MTTLKSRKLASANSTGVGALMRSWRTDVRKLNGGSGTLGAGGQRGVRNLENRL
jgi:hypothetical protein